MFNKILELIDDGLIFRKDKGNTGEIGEENRGIIDGDVLFITDHVFYHLSNDVQGKENIVELDYLVVAFQVSSYLFDYFAGVGG